MTKLRIFTTAGRGRGFSVLRRTAAAVCLALLAPSIALAADPTPEAKQEAGERFQHGVSLYQAGNLNSALAEFERAYELMPHPTVLFNIGLTYADLDRPVEATSSLSKLVASPGALSGDRLTRAKDVLEAQRSKTGTLDVKVTVEGAQIEVDGVIVGIAPLKEALILTTGLHVVGAIAPAHAPQRRSLTIASKAAQTMELDPPVLDARLAHLTVKTTLPGADLYVDGELTARTPLPASLALMPGAHEFVLKRDGYRDARTSLVLGEGASGEITLNCEEDTIATETRGGDLDLKLTESLASVTVDGVSRGLYAAPLRLPAGPHELVVERAGFRTMVRHVTIDQGKEKSVPLELEPTPDWRAQYVEGATRRRTASIVTIIAGSAVTLGFTGFLVWNNVSNIPDRQDEFDDLANKCLTSQTDVTTCQTLTRRSDDVNAALTLNVLGGVGVTIGAIGAGIGVVLLATGPDPHKYEPKSTETLSLTPIVAPLAGGGYVGAMGTF